MSDRIAPLTTGDDRIAPLTASAPELDPLPVVWNGHTPHNAKQDFYRTGVRLDLHEVFDYRFAPRPGYEQDRSKYEN